MKSVYWLALVVLAALYVKYYYVIGPRLLLLLASLYAGRLLLNRLHRLLSGRYVSMTLKHFVERI